MSETGPGTGVRTLAVRLSEDLRAQLDVIAQITGRSTTEEIRVALESWVEKTKADPTILQKAAAVRAEIEKEAQTKQNAIASIFGTKEAAADVKDDSAPAERPGGRRGKTSGE